MMRRRDVLRSACGAALSLPFLHTSQVVAQERPIRLIVPFAPGGAVDGLARHFGQALSAVMGGRTIVIDNRGGTGGMIGTAAVAKAPPDGTTLGIIGVGPLCAVPFLFKEVPYNPAKDLQPITRLVDSPLLCVVNAETARRNGWDSFESMIKWAMANQGKFTFGSGGIGGAGHLYFAALLQRLGIDAIHVAYKGGGPLIIDMLAGRLDATFDGAGATLAHVKRGAFKALAVSMPQRFPLLPDVPGLAEFPGLKLQNHSMNGWHALMAPGGTPATIVDPLNAAVQKVLHAEAFKRELAPMVYATATDSGPASLAAQAARETPRFKALVEAAGIKPS